MFDTVVVSDLGAVACADAVVATVAEQRRAAATRLALAAHWADLHAPLAEDEVDPSWPVSRRRRLTRTVAGGGDGTPDITEFAAMELGTYLQTTTGTAARLIRDALDLRLRHPLLWTAVMTGQVEDWQARKVANATSAADLTCAQARQVDTDSVQAVIGLPFGRAMAVVEGRSSRSTPKAMRSAGLGSPSAGS